MMMNLVNQLGKACAVRGPASLGWPSVEDGLNERHYCASHLGGVVRVAGGSERSHM